MSLRTSPETSLRGIILTLLIALLLIIILILISSSSPARALRSFFISPLSNVFFFGNMLNSASIILLTALGAGLAFNAGLFNLGGEGQVYLGAFVATVFLLRFSSLPGWLGIFLGFTVAVLSSALLAGLSGFFKAAFDTDELLSSFLLSGAFIPLIDYLIIGPFDDPSSNLLATSTIARKFHLSSFLEPSNLNSSLFIALLASVLIYIYLYKSISGYELRMSGKNRYFAKYGGINVGLYTILPLILSGALHGLAGSAFVLGTHHASISGFTAGAGWNGLAVALIGRNHPLLMIPAALVFAFLQSGAQAAMLEADFSFQLSAVIRAVIFFLITAEALIKTRSSHAV